MNEGKLFVCMQLGNADTQVSYLIVLFMLLTIALYTAFSAFLCLSYEDLMLMILSLNWMS